MYQKLAEEAFDLIEVDDHKCYMCDYFISIPDIYSIWNYPAEYECSGDWNVCPRQEEIDKYIGEALSESLIAYAEGDLTTLVQAIKNKEDIGPVIERNLF